MEVARYKKELAVMMKEWGFASERQTILCFIQSIYIARANPPELAITFTKMSTDEDLARAFVALMDSSRKDLAFIDIDLLNLKPVGEQK